MKKNYLIFKKTARYLTAAVMLLSFSKSFGQTVTTVTLGYTGAVQNYTVPSLCVSQITVEVWGAEGGGSALSLNTASGFGGKGGYAKGTLTVVPNSVLAVYVGGFGQSSTSGAAAGGFNGGGSGYASSSSEPGNGGGGATDIRVGGTALSNRVIVAGGGGGGGEDAGDSYGNGGGLTGVGYASYDATQTTAGAGGALGVGGGTNLGDGGGGGGGYYGGGTLSSSSIGTDTQGGGGGSGYIGGVTSGTLIDGASVMPNPAGGTMTGRSGNGFVRISYIGGNAIAVSASPSVICLGGSSNLTASGVVSYTWNSGSNSTLVTVSPSSNTTYTVAGTDAAGCTSSLTITVPVDPGVPSLTVANSASATSGICPGKTATLTASGATTYTWAGATAVTNGVSFAPTVTSGYTVSGQNACGTTTAVTSISIHPTPSVSAVVSTPSICSGATVSMTGVGNSTAYVWTGGISNGVAFAPSTSTTYTVIGTSALSCTASATSSILVVTTPSASPIASPILICIGNSSTLTTTGATNYTWSSSTGVIGSSSSVVVTPTAPVNTYTIVKSNANCVDTKTISVLVNQLPTVFAIVTPTIVCAGSQASLAVGGGQTYTWTSPAPNSYTFTGASPLVSPQVSSTYTVAASDGTCINTTTVYLATNPVPTIALSVSPSSVICKGQSVNVSASGGVNYTWTSTSGTVYTSSFTDSPTAPISYQVMADNSFSCTSTANQIVLVNPTPTINVAVTKTLVCTGGPSTLTASGANTYTWDSGAQTAATIVNPVATNVYTVGGTYTLTGCQSTKTVQVSVFMPSITVTSPTNTCFGGNITLVASGANPNTYNWNTGSGFTNPFQTIAVTPTVFTTYTVSANTTSNNVTCPSTATTSIGIFYNPTITATPQRTFVCRGESVNLYGNGGVSYSWSNAQTGNTITVSPLTNTNYTVTGTDANGCVNTGTIQVKISGCVGITENSAQNTGLVVYPNPNNGEFMVHANADINLNITNELGQIIRVIQLTGSNNYQVQITDLAKGVYFITGQKDNVNIHQKVVVAK